MNRTSCEVAVVGAGPAGCWTAARLAEQGHDVILADENTAARSDVVCTGIVGQEAFDRFDLPREAVVDTVPRARFISPSEEEVIYEPATPLAEVVDRTAFDGALARWAENQGASLLRGWAARSVEKERGKVTVGFRTGEGADEELRARALVVATGHQRWLHDAAGLGTPERYVHGVHADLPFEPVDAAELYFGQELAPGFFAWAVPFGDDIARLGVLSPQGSRRHFEQFLEHPAIRDRVQVPPREDIPLREAPWLHSRGIVQGAVEPSFADRVLAVGEAAGQVKTTTAGGIYYGLQGGEFAAEVLDDALQGDALDAGSLARYHQAWTGRLGPEIEAGLELQAAVRDLSDDEIDEIFRALQRGVASTIWSTVKFDWHRSALKILFEHPRVRSRLVDGAVEKFSAPVAAT